LVALVLAAVIAISLTSYMKMASTAATISQRSFMANDAMNVTEAALEQMLWTFNQASAAANAGNSSTAVWTSNNWTLSGSNATRTFDSSYFSLSQNASGQAKVYIENYDSPGIPTPIAVAKAIITPANGVALIKMVKVNLARSSFFSSGLVAKDGITFSGNNATVDSYNSNPNNASPSPNYAYGTADAPARANGSIACTNVNATAVIGNANIYGYVSVGASSSTAVQMNSNGVISSDLTATSGRDESRITTNYTSNLPDISAPTSYTNTSGVMTAIPWQIYKEGSSFTLTGSGNCQLPLNSDVNGNKGATTKTTVNGVTTYKTTYYYTVQEINLTGNPSNQLTVRDGYNVVIWVVPQTGDGAGQLLVQTSGSAGITIGTGATLGLYTAANIDISGGSSTTTTGTTPGISNPNSPSSFQIWGTGTASESQTIKVSGNGSLSGIVYAPNANVSIVGNGNVYGAVVGKQINVTGEAAFHYDESLANFGGSNPFKISSWTELLSQSARNVYLTQLNGSSPSF
jgi:hypothetical protein